VSTPMTVRAIYCNDPHPACFSRVETFEPHTVYTIHATVLCDCSGCLAAAVPFYGERLPPCLLIAEISSLWGGWAACLSFAVALLLSCCCWCCFLARGLQGDRFGCAVLLRCAVVVACCCWCNACVSVCGTGGYRIQAQRSS